MDSTTSAVEFRDCARSQKPVAKRLPFMTQSTYTFVAGDGQTYGPNAHDVIQ